MLFPQSCDQELGFGFYVRPVHKKNHENPVLLLRSIPSHSHQSVPGCMSISFVFPVTVMETSCPPFTDEKTQTLGEAQRSPDA